jgi:hypothetical protein
MVPLNRTKGCSQGVPFARRAGVPFGSRLTERDHKAHRLMKRSRSSWRWARQTLRGLTRAAWSADRSRSQGRTTGRAEVLAQAIWAERVSVRTDLLRYECFPERVTNLRGSVRCSNTYNECAIQSLKHMVRVETRCSYGVAPGLNWRPTHLRIQHVVADPERARGFVEQAPQRCGGDRTVIVPCRATPCSFK